MSYNFKIVGGDTDSILFCKQEMTAYTKEEQNRLIQEINYILPENIKFEHDGIFDRVIYLKAKNYIMYNKEKDKLTIKGSSLKSATLEPIFKEFLNECIRILVFDDHKKLPEVYQKYVDMIDNIVDITPWCKKLTISQKTLAGKRKNETDILDCIKGKEYGSGDKIYVITKSKVVETGELYKVGKTKGQPKTKVVKYLCLKEDYTEGYDKNTYYHKLYKITERFKTILPIKELFKKFVDKEEE